jgi:hypothetical protein
MTYNVEATFGSKSHQKLRPWLMVCFAIGWGLLGLLVVLQDHAIDAQRDLIRLLLQDLHQGLTTPLGHRSMSSVPVVNAQLPSSQVQSQRTPSVQVPAVPSSKVRPQGKGSSRAPSSQENAARANPGRSSRLAAKPLPVRPPAEIVDPSDMRRVTFSI